MRPAKLLLIILGCWAALALLLALVRPFLEPGNDRVLTLIWWLTGGSILLGCIIDYFLSFVLKRLGLKRLGVERHLPNTLSLGINNRVKLCIHNPLHRAVNMIVSDHHPSQIEITKLPASLSVPATSTAEVYYNVFPLRRGDASFDTADLRVSSHWGLWQLRLRRGLPQRVKIYPNFAAISQYDRLGHDQQVNQLGIHVSQRRGQGMDFNQLREFREGDPLRQVDWKASARMRKLISRQYQDERDQDIIFLLDCGRRLRAKDGVLSHFDHCLNALLLTSYVASRHGDAVGLMTFAGEQRWYKPKKGKAVVSALLNQVYDLHSSTETSDFVSAAQALMNRHRKRSLIILITNVRDEDADNLSAAVRLLMKQHIVLVASLRENFLDQKLQQNVANFEDALAYSGSVDFFERRRQLLDKLSNSGVIISDSLPQLMYAALVNQYLLLKRSGRI